MSYSSIENEVTNDSGTPLAVAVTTTGDVVVKAGDSVNSAVRVNVVAGSAGGTQFAEDAPHTTGDIGTMALGVRRDGNTALGADNDYTPFTTDSEGSMWVALGNALPSGTNNIGDVDVLTVPAPLNVVGGGTEAAALRVTIANNTTGFLNIRDFDKILDNNPFIDGAQYVNPAGFIYDSTWSALTDGDIAAARITVNRSQLHVIEDGVTRDRFATVTASNALKTDGSAVTQPVSIAATVGTQEVASVVDNAGFTDGATRVLMQGYIFDEVAGTALTENDGAAARINLNRSQTHVIEDGATRGRYATISASNALKVDVASAIAATAATGTATNVAASLTNVTVLASNASRKGATVHNDGTTAGNVAPLYLKLGATASLTSFTAKLVVGAYYEVPYGYTGIIDGIWGTGGISGTSARVCELT